MPKSVSAKAGTRVAFGDVVRLSRERSSNPASDGFEHYVGLDHLDPGDLRIRRWGDTSDGTTFTNVFRSGQVLFGKRRAYQRKVALADFAGVCSGDIYVLESKSERLSPEFLPFVCQSDGFFEHAIGTSSGSLSPRTNWASMISYEFALPSPEEQSRIAEVLTAVSSWYYCVRAILDSASDLKITFGRYVLSRRSDLPRVPLGAIAKFTSGGQIPVGSLPRLPTTSASVPVYGGNGLAGYVSAPLPGCSQATVVVGRVGQYCGTALLTDGPAWVTDNALYPASLKTPTDMRFLAACLEGADLNRGKLGEYLPLITQKVVHSVEIPLVPLDEQQALGRRYQDIIETIRATARRLAEADLVRKKVFSRLLGQAS